jgi:hypothetical protein
MTEAIANPTLCNWCGEPCVLGEGPDPSVPLHNEIGEGGLLKHTIRVMGGYDSTPGNGCGALDDCTSYTFSLCEFCLDHLFTLFKNSPTVDSINNPEPEVFAAAAHRVAMDRWREHKMGFFKEQARRAALRPKRV